MGGWVRVWGTECLYFVMYVCESEREGKGGVFLLLLLLLLLPPSLVFWGRLSFFYILASRGERWVGEWREGCFV